MIRKLDEKDLSPLMKYLEKDAHLNLFFIGDLLADGFDDNIQEFYGYYKEDVLVGAILIYMQSSLHLFADEVGEDLIDFIIDQYHMYPLLNINVGTRTFELLGDRLDGIIGEVKKTRLSVYYPNEIEVDTTLVKRLSKDEISDLLMVQDTIFTGKAEQNFDVRLKRMQETYERDSSWFYGVVVEGGVQAVGTATAFTPNSAMIVAVGTKASQRKKGYASALVKALSDALYKEGKHGVLFYDNPDAARIYERLGYEFHSYYYMLMLKSK